MGGSKSGSQVIGYKYFLGMHLVFGQGPMDALLELKFGERTAWTGVSAGGRIRIDKPELYGSKNEEGGVSGSIDVEMGASAQVRNDYLQSVLGPVIPAYRGVAALVLRGFYLGNNPYIKPIGAKWTSCRSHFGDWYPEKCIIGRDIAVDANAIYIAMDVSSSMAGSKLTTEKIAVSGFIDSLRGSVNSLKIVTFDSAVVDTIERFDCSDADYDALIAFVDGITASADSVTSNVAQSYGATTKTTGTAPKSYQAAPVFEKGSLNTNSFNNLTLTPELGVLTNDLDLANGWVYMYTDLTDLPDGTQFNYANQLKIYANYDNSVSNRVSVTAWTQAQLDADGPGTTTILVNEAFGSGTSDSIVDRDFDYTPPAGAVVLRWKDEVRGPYYFSGLYTKTARTQPAITYLAPVGADYDAGVSLADQFYDDAAATGGSLLDYSFGATFDFGLFDTGATTERQRRVLIFLSNGEPDPTSSAAAAAATMSAISEVEVYAINVELTDTSYTALLDNTAIDGIPVISGSDPDAIQIALGFAFVTYQDMNPAHIGRDAILDPGSGGTGDAAEIGDTFTAAADTLYAEGFGLSLFWENGLSRDEFQQLVERHIDGNFYVDRLTGKWEIKLIRDDYDVETLPVLDASIITDWQEASRSMPAELPNYVSLTYTRREDGEPTTLSLANLGALQTVGRIRAEKVEYPGITRAALASRVLLRDTIALTTPLWTGACTVAWLDPALNKGSVVIINEPRIGMNNVVVRLTEIEESDGADTSVLIRFVEDVFALPDDILVADAAPAVASATDALPGSIQMVEEVPYYLVALQQGQADLDADLAAEPDLGYFHATEDRPNGFHINAKITVDTGSGWVDTGVTDYAPAPALLGALTADPEDITVEIENIAALSAVIQGSLCSIGSEYLRVDDLVVTGSTVTATLGRGCLDSVPDEHQIGDKILFFQGLANSDMVQFLAGEEIDVRIRGRTSLDEVKISEAPNTHIVFDSRAIRPYPAGNVKIDGSYLPPSGWSGSATITWAHRDRTLQTTTSVEDFTAGDIGPEPGTTYRVRVEAFDSAGDSLGIFIDTNVGAVTTYDLTDISAAPANTVRIGISVLPERDGYTARAEYQFAIDLWYKILLSGDAQSGADYLQPSGDMQDGSDVMRTT